MTGMEIKSNRTIFILLILALLIPVLSGCSGSPQKTSVRTDSREPGNQPVQAFGICESGEELDITFAFPVRIEKIEVREGQSISGGAPLAVMDAGGADNEVLDMEDRLRMLKEDILHKKTLLGKKKQALSDRMEPEVLKLENLLKKAGKEYERLSSGGETKNSLYRAGVLTESDYQDYLMKVENAGFEYRDAELSLESMRRSMETGLMQLENEIRSDQQQAGTLERNLKERRKQSENAYRKGNAIICPIQEGIVSEISCREGEIVPAGGILFRILDGSFIFVEAYVDEQFIKDVKIGAKAYVIPESDTSQEYRGKVTAVSALAIQKSSETVIPVRIELDKVPGDLRPGCNAEISIETE